MNIYEELGIEPIINAVGPSTRLSGSIMRAEVAEAPPAEALLNRVFS